MGLPTTHDWLVFGTGCFAGASVAVLLLRLRASSAEAASGQLPAAITALTVRIGELQQTIALATTTRSTKIYSEDDDDDVFVDSSETPLPRGESAAARAPQQQGLDALFERVEELRDSGSTLEAADLLQREAAAMPESAELLWRQARACFDRSEVDVKQKQTHLETGRSLAQRALELAPQNSNCHKWYGILSGSLADTAPLKDKVALGLLFKTHVEQAIALDASDPNSHHLLGQFCFEVAGMSWVTKRACKAFLADPPEATYEEALACFVKAEELKPNFWKRNILMLAKTHKALGNTADFREFLQRCLAMPSVTPDVRWCCLWWWLFVFRLQWGA
eukprot:m.45577 g.45577  ORF g.45577 m.45577 type:complete len:335 (+) comp14682_c0_seq1:58-1062(+)